MYLSHHGPHSLAPKRAENMKFSMVSSLQRIPADGSIRVGSIRWDDTAHDVFIFRRLTRFMMFTGFRLAEIVGNGSGEIMFLTYGCLFWCIDNVMIAKPSRAQLLSMRPGRDGAVVFPPRSKPDQWGETHCPFPVRLTYETTELNPAAALRDLELNIGEQVTDRDSHPLFGDAAGQTYTHHYLHNLLKLALAHLYGAAVAALYTWHSFRSGLATALHAANVPDAMIMLICRWMCPESLHVYRRMGTRENERLINEASAMNVDAIQSANVVRVVGDQGYAALFSPICSLTSQLTRETLIGRPTPRSTRVPASSRPQSLSRLQRRHRSGSLCARSHSSLLTSGLRPASSSCRVLYDLATPWSFQPACGRPTRAKSSEAQDGQPPYAASTDQQPESLSMSRRRAMVVPMKTNYYHSTISEWQSSNRPDFPPASPCGNRDFGLTCRTATGNTEPTVRCVVYIHSFPTTSRTQEGGFSAQRDMSSCSGRLNHGRTGWGP